MTEQRAEYGQGQLVREGNRQAAEASAQGQAEAENAQAEDEARAEQEKVDQERLEALAFQVSEREKELMQDVVYALDELVGDPEENSVRQTATSIIGKVRVATAEQQRLYKG